METRAAYVVVGVFAILLLIGGIVGAIWFGGVQLDQETRSFRIHFEGSVTGLSIGSPVRYRGVPVGTVTGISIDAEDVERIRVDVEIDAEVPVKRDMYAVLEAQGLTGIGFIQIEGGTAAADDLLPAPGETVALIPSRSSALTQIFETAPQIADQLVVLLARVQAFLSPENEQALQTILANLATVSVAIGNRTDEIEMAIVEGAAAARDVRLATAEIVPLVETLNREIESLSEETSATLATVRGTAAGLDAEVVTLSRSLAATSEKIGGTAAQLEQLVAESRPGMRDFANQGLYELTEFLIEARVLVANLDRVLRKIDRDPGQFLFGNRDGQVEAE